MVKYFCSSIVYGQEGRQGTLDCKLKIYNQVFSYSFVGLKLRNDINLDQLVLKSSSMQTSTNKLKLKMFFYNHCIGDVQVINLYFQNQNLKKNFNRKLGYVHFNRQTISNPYNKVTGHLCVCLTACLYRRISLATEHIRVFFTGQLLIGPGKVKYHHLPTRNRRNKVKI